MPRIKIKDLSKSRKVSKEEMRNVIGGTSVGPPFTFVAHVDNYGTITRLLFSASSAATIGIQPRPTRTSTISKT